MKLKNMIFPVFIFFLIFCLSFFFLKSYFIQKPIIYTIDRDKPMIALTFDDGPNSHYTPQLLKLLDNQQVLATFFVTGENIRRYPLLIKKMAHTGHELANHTFSHQDLTKLSSRQIKQQIYKTESAIQKIIPDYKLKYVRPPYGHVNDDVKKNINQPLVLWSLDSGDWSSPQAENIYHTVLHQIKDQDIIVFHDDNQQTISALKKLIPKLKAKGFQFVTVSQLHAYKKI